MKKLLLKRILPFMMAMIMLVTFCLPAGAFSFGSPDTDDGDAAYYSIELRDGILHVVLNPQKLYDVLRDGDFTKEELKEFIPEDVLNTLSNNPSVDDLLALASEYLSKEDVQSLLDLLPKEILTEHFLNKGFLESLITLEEIMSTISIDELLAGVEDQDKFNSDLNEMLTPYLDVLMTENVINNLMSNTAFIETILADAIDRILADEEQRQLVMDALPNLVTDDVINAILGNDAYKEALTQMIIHNDAVLNKIQNDSATIHKLAEYLETHRDIAESILNDQEIIADLQNHPDWLINETVVKYMFVENKLTPSILHEVFGDDVINDMVAGEDGEYALLEELMHNDTLITSLIESDGFTAIADTLMTDELFKLALSEIDITDYITFNQAFATEFGITLEDLIDKDYVTLDADFLGEFGITLADLIDKGYVTLDEDFAAEFGITADSLVNKGYVTLNDSFANEFGITAEDLINKGHVTLNEQFAATFGITANNLLSKGYISFNAAFADEFGITPAGLIDNDLLTFDEDFAAEFGITPENLVDYGHVNADDILNEGLVNPDVATLIDRGLINIAGVLADARYGITMSAVLASENITLDTAAIIAEYNVTAKDAFDAGLVDVDGVVADEDYAITPEAAFDAGLIDIDAVLADGDYGITPAAVFAADLVNIDGILSDSDYNISLEDVFTGNLVDLDAILDDEDYGIDVAAIFEKDLVDLDGIMNDEDYNITLDRLGLSNTQLKEIADTLLANPTTKTALMDTFTAKVKAEEILPSQFIDLIDFRAIALDENNGIDLVGMVEELLKNDANADAHLAALFNRITLTEQDMRNIMNEMGQEACMAILEDHFTEIIEDLGGPNAILRHFDDKMALVDALFGDADTPGFIALITPDAATGTALVNFDDIAIALGGTERPTASNEEKKTAGFGILISMLDTAAVANELGDLLLQYASFGQIAEAMGGFGTILSWYEDEPEVLTTVIEGIGTDRLVQFAKDNGLLSTDNLKSIGKDIADKILNDKARLKAFIANAKDGILQIILEDIDSLAVNNTVFFKNGRFDLQSLVYAILNSIPDVETFCEMEEGDSIFALIFKATYHTEDDPTIFGLDVSFDGDFTQLQTLASYHEDLFRFDVNEELDIKVSSELPKQVARLYTKILESDRLPDTLKAKLLEAPTLSIAELSDLLVSFSDDEILALSDAVAEKILEVLPQAMEKGDALIDRIPDEVIDKGMDISLEILERIPDGVIDRVTNTLIKLTTVDGMQAALKKASVALGKLPAQNLSVDQFYTRDGNFTMDPKTFAVDPMDHTDLLNKLPAKLQNLAQSVLSEIPDGLLDLSLSGSFAASLTLTGVYRLTLVDEDRNENVFFLPEGVELSVLESIGGLDLTLWGENLPEFMPGQDTVVYAPLSEEEAELIFIYHEPIAPFRAIEYDRIRYIWGETTLDVTPNDPPVFRGYRANVPDYLAEMNIERSREIHVTYSADQFNLTFNLFNGTNVVIPFGIDSELVIGNDAITLNGTVLPELTASDTSYSFKWVNGNESYASTREFAEELEDLLSDPLAALSDITLTETRVAREYKLTFLDENDEILDEVTYSIESDANELSGRIPGAPNHADAGYYYKWMLVSTNGTDVEPTEWSKDNFLASFRQSPANYTIKAEEAIEVYYYHFHYLSGTVASVPYTIETTRAQFAENVPTVTTIRGYTYYWETEAGALWSTALFAEHDANALGDYHIYEDGGIDTYTFTVTLLDGNVITVPYNILSDVDALRAEFTSRLPENTRAYTYKYERFIEAPAAQGVALLANAPEGEWEDWDPADFTMDDLGHLVLRQAAVPVEYTFTIHKLDGSVATVPYTIETAKADLMAALLAERNANTNGYTYTWEIKNGDAWSAWSETAVDPENIDYLNNYEIKVVRTANIYTVTFDMAEGADVTVDYTIETPMAEFVAPAHTVSQAYNYNAWLKGADAWTVETLFGADGVLSEDELASFTVTETGPAIPYTLTFTPMVGEPVEVIYTIETSYEDFLEMIPDLGTPADIRTHERFWKANNAEWFAETVYGTDHALAVSELASYTVTEEERLIIYTITFDMANVADVEVKYDMNGLLPGYSFPTITANSNAYTYKWQRDGVDWDPATFTVTEYVSFTVVELKTAVDYTWTFIPLVGQPVTVTVNMDRTAAQIKADMPALGTDASKVYAYSWFYQGPSTLLKRDFTRWRSVANSDLVDLTFTEKRTIHDNNTITFYPQGSSDVLAVYYYDAENFYVRDENFNETPVPNNALPNAPELFGYSFTNWSFDSCPLIRPNGTVFDVDTFRSFVTYGNATRAKVKVRATYAADQYTLYFHMLDPQAPVVEVKYNIETDKHTLQGIPELLPSNQAFKYYWTSGRVGGSPWTLENSFHPQTVLGDIHIYENAELLEYVVTFVRANGDRKNVLLTFNTTRTEFASQIPEQVNNAAFERSWTMNGATWTIDSLYTNGEQININMLNDYRIEEKEIAHAFMLTFKDLDGNLITEVIYNGYGPLFGQIPELPSSDDGYLYSWYNVTDDAPWAGFDPMACRNLELRLTRAPIVYNLTFVMKETGEVLSTATYTVLDHSFVIPTIAPRAGYEQVWYYMDGETVRYWTREDLTIGDLVLYADFVPLKYTITFNAEDGTQYIFVMTVENKNTPSVPPKAGHTGTWYVQLGSAPADTDPKWSDYKLYDGGLNVTVYVRYSPLPYYIDFMIDGVFFGSGTFMLGGDWTPPAAPERPGYTAEWYIQSGDTWVKWSEYKLESGSSKLMAKVVYTPIVYSAKFFADGKLVGTTNFTVEDSKLSKIPAVPAKAGFTGVWSDYKIGPGDLEIHAIYTAIEEPAHPLEGKDFLLFIDGFVGGLYDSDPDGLHWIWWLIILILLILIIITLIILLVVLKRKKKDTPPEEPETEPEPVIVPVPEDEEPEEEELEEILDTVDVETADEMMTDTTAMAALETVGGAKAAGMKSIINISKINENFEANDTVDIETLKSKKLIPAKTERLKVLGDGHLDKPLTVVADSFSIQAIKMITLTGGKAVQKKAEK